MALRWNGWLGKQMFVLVGIVTCAFAGSPTRTSADQLTLSEKAPVVYGHHHLNVTSIDAHKKFWVEGLGGAVATLEGLPTTIIRFPNVLVFLRQQAPKGGMKGAAVSRLGFDVKSLKAATDTLRAAGFQVVKNTVTGPDGVELELVENGRLPQPIALRDVQFSTADPEATSAWYLRIFGATVTAGRKPPTVTLPGLALLFARSGERTAGTQGSVMDHIGFEVRNLEAFCAELQGKGVTFERPYFKVPKTELAIAFLTDPWGTYIELTEGLNRVK